MYEQGNVLPVFRADPPDVYQLSATGPRRNPPWLTVPIKAMGGCSGPGCWTGMAIAGVGIGTIATVGLVGLAVWAIARPEGQPIIPFTDIGR